MLLGHDHLVKIIQHGLKVSDTQNTFNMHIIPSARRFLLEADQRSGLKKIPSLEFA
jgi:hypothetical protein